MAVKIAEAFKAASKAAESEGYSLEQSEIVSDDKIPVALLSGDQALLDKLGISRDDYDAKVVPFLTRGNIRDGYISKKECFDTAGGDQSKNWDRLLRYATLVTISQDANLGNMIDNNPATVFSGALPSWITQSTHVPAATPVVMPTDTGSYSPISVSLPPPQTIPHFQPRILEDPFLNDGYVASTQVNIDGNGKILDYTFTLFDPQGNPVNDNKILEQYSEQYFKYMHDIDAQIVHDGENQYLAEDWNGTWKTSSNPEDGKQAVIVASEQAEDQADAARMAKLVKTHPIMGTIAAEFIGTRKTEWDQFRRGNFSSVIANGGLTYSIAATHPNLIPIHMAQIQEGTDFNKIYGGYALIDGASGVWDGFWGGVGEVWDGIGDVATVALGGDLPDDPVDSRMAATE